MVNMLLATGASSSMVQTVEEMQVYVYILCIYIFMFTMYIAGFVHCRWVLTLYSGLSPVGGA